MSDFKIETSPSEAVIFEDVAHQIKAVTDLLTQQLAHLCELMKQLRDGQTHRRHDETASSGAASTSTSLSGRHLKQFSSQKFLRATKNGTKTLDLKNVVLEGHVCLELL